MEKELLESILDKWEIEHPIIKDMYKKDSEGIERIIFRISTDNQDFIIKGIPNKEESIIQSNVQAHLFLGNEHSIAPKLFPTKEGTYYIKEQGYYFYLMEYIDGRSMEENVLDEYQLGQLAHKLHSLKGYSILSPFTQSKKKYYNWFGERDFKKMFDEILDSLPDFCSLSQCFVHTDIGPHNAMVRQNGEAVFIDLDDAGIGSRYLDMGWPFIMQFVDFNHETGEMNYRFDLAQSFLKGYYGESAVSKEEYDLIFQGAIQMHITYMQTYGPYAVDSLWKILQFGIDQKDTLWEELNNNKKFV